VRPVALLSSSRVVTFGLVAVSLAATVILLADVYHGPYPVLALIVVAFAALGLVLARPQLRRGLRLGTVLALSGALLVAATVAPPRSNEDLWAYAMYGRIIVEYGANPYVHPPSDYADDPLFDRVFWQDTTARYGPVFIGITAIVASGAGSSPLATRLGYQGLAAVSVFLALMLVARQTRSAAAVAAIGLNPVTAYVVVNGGHNDALVGLGILLGVILAKRDKPIPATMALTAAALVKATAGLALVAYLVWLAYRRRPSTLVGPVAVAAGISIPLLLVFGLRNVISPLAGARETVLPHSPWNLLRSGGVERALGLDLYGPVGSPGSLSTIAFVFVVLVAAVVVLGHVRDATPFFVITGAVLAYLFASIYTPPWFAAWVFPALALHWRARVSLCAFAFFAMLTIDEVYGHAIFPQAFSRQHNFQVLLATWINTLAMVAAAGALAVLVAFAVTARGRPDAPTGQSPAAVTS